MAQDLTAAQSNWISLFRTGVANVITRLQSLQFLQGKLASLGTPDTFVEGAFAGNNSDVTAAQLNAALAELTTLQASFYNTSTGAPTELTTTLLSVVPVTQQ